MSWKLQRRANKYLQLNTIVFSDSLHGWIGGDSSTILRTRDGGATWMQINPMLDHGLTAGQMSTSQLKFVNDTFGFALAKITCPGCGDFYDYLCITKDGGTTWKENYDYRHSDRVHLKGIYFFSDTGSEQLP